jgi:serine/threonine protein phosphatase PrpC
VSDETVAALAMGLHKPGVLGVHDGEGDSSCGLCRERARQYFVANSDHVLIHRDRLEADSKRQAAEKDIIFEDLRAILRALGLGDHARLISAHDVVQREILPALARLAHLAPQDEEPPK